METWTLLAESLVGFTGTDLATAISLTGGQASNHDELAWLVEEDGGGLFRLERAPRSILEGTYGGHARPPAYTRMPGNDYSELKLVSDTAFGVRTSGTRVWAVWGIKHNGGFTAP